MSQQVHFEGRPRPLPPTGQDSTDWVNNIQNDRDVIAQLDGMRIDEQPMDAFLDDIDVDDIDVVRQLDIIDQRHAPDATVSYPGLAGPNALPALLENDIDINAALEAMLHSSSTDDFLQHTAARRAPLRGGPSRV